MLCMYVHLGAMPRVLLEYNRLQLTSSKLITKVSCECADTHPRKNRHFESLNSQQEVLPEEQLRLKKRAESNRESEEKKTKQNRHSVGER